MKNLYKILLKVVFVISLPALTVFGQTDSIENLTATIDKNPNAAANYLKRGDLYAELWNTDKNTEKIVNIAFAAADYSKYIKLNPNHAESRRKRAAARFELFLGVNPFTIADLQKILQLNPKDFETAARLKKYQSEYRQMHQTEECREGRKINGFQGHPSDEPLTFLSGYLSPEMSDDNKEALKAIACGANVNYKYKKGSLSPELSNFDYYRVEHLIALLEAGANTEARDKSGNTPLMITLKTITSTNAEIDENLFTRLKILLSYGARINAVNRRRQSVLSFAEKTGNAELTGFLQKMGAK